MPADEITNLESTVTMETLEETPERVLKLLRGVGMVPAIHARLMGRGYTDATHREGWDLLQAASGFRPGEVDPPVAANDPRIRDAIAALDGVDEPMLRIVGATLQRHFPALATEVLDGLKATTGVGSVLVISTVLDRIDALATRGETDDQAALELLEERGYGADERARLRGLVQIAQSVPDVVPVDPAAVEETERRYKNALIRLRSWYEEWSEIARACIHRRDHLIRLGLASRRHGPSGKPEGGSESGGEDDGKSE